MIIVADTETTGVGSKAKMVEFGYIEVDDSLGVITEFQSLVDPEMHIPFGASAIHNILDEHVSQEPTVEELFDIVLKDVVFEDVWLIAHNAVFDKRFLAPHINISKTICTLRLAKQYCPNADSHKLMALAYELDLPRPEGDAHRALYDVQVTLALLLRILTDSGKTLPELVTMLSKPQKITTMPFGKHKGSKLTDIPAGYIKWLLTQDTLDEDLRWSLENLNV